MPPSASLPPPYHSGATPWGWGGQREGRRTPKAGETTVHFEPG